MNSTGLCYEYLFIHNNFMYSQGIFVMYSYNININLVCCRIVSLRLLSGWLLSGCSRSSSYGSICCLYSVVFSTETAWVFVCLIMRLFDFHFG